MTSLDQAAAAHVVAFNDAVATGRWESFAERFATDAEMDFVGVPAGPFRGRDGIAAAYAADPPREGIDAGQVAVDGDVVDVPFRWRETGGTGRMRLEYAADGLVRRLSVTFD